MSEPAKQAEELEALIGSTLAERYRIDALLGMGGMGAVFRAHHLLLKRDVAVKVLHRDLVANEDISRRFDREAQSAARLDHPNVIPVTEFGSTDAGMKYMVMQLLEGEELSHLLGQPLEPMRAIELEIQILRGLEHAHGKGVIHRDLKPENVFVTQDHEGDEVLKLVDFGIAKIVDEEETEDGKPLTRMGLVFGTPHYMSPEQATGSAIDHRTDIYSAGVLLYQMLSGKVPFDHDDPVSLIRMQVTVDPPPLPNSVPLALIHVVQRMMAKAKDERYPDARSARKDLQSVHATLARELGAPVRFSSEDTGVVDPRDIYGPGGVPGSASGSGAIAASSGPGISGPNTVAGDSNTLSPTSPTMMPVAPTAAHPTYPTAHPTSAHPTLQHSLAAIPRKWLYVGGGIIGLLVLIAMWPSGKPDEDGGEADSSGVVVGAGDGDDGSSKSSGDGDDDGEPVANAKPGVSEETLIAIDQALTSKNDEAALDLIRPARDKFPADPQLLWREGKALALKRAKSSRVTALERYGEALDHDPNLIDDPDFYAELYALLRNSSLQEAAVNLALQKLGVSGHKFLLELVNVDDPKKMLGWVDRHRVLNELNSSEESQKLVDWQLNLARDLYQAPQAPKPCIAFRETLDGIGKSEDVYFVEHIFNSKLVPPEFTSGDPEDGEACGGLAAQLEQVRGTLAEAYPEEAAKYGPSKKTPSKKKKKGLFGG